MLNADGRYYVRVYLNNGASEEEARRDTMTATNTRIRFEIPSGAANGFTLQATVSADNARPREIYDVVTLKNDETQFDVDYVTGSARLYSSAHPEGFPLDDEIVRRGVLLGTKTLDGLFPPGYANSAFVVVEVAAVPIS